MFQLDSDIYNKNRQMQLSERLGAQNIAASQQDMAVNDQAMKAKEIEQMVGMITPENYSAMRQQAIAKGLISEQSAPLAYDANWVQQVRSAFGSSKTSDGGSTGVLVDRLMKENPKLSFGDALYQVQTGFRQNMQSEGGRLSVMLGAPEAKSALKYAETSGGNQSDLKYKPLIREAESQVDLVNKPLIESATAEAGVIGKERGEKTALLKSMQSKFPQLTKTVNELKELGKKATYTLAGRAADEAIRQTGPLTGVVAGEGAVERQKYINKVRDVLFPQLRDTFGAQFTAAEGERLVQTLGDPNLSPPEKEAVLDAFIEEKMKTIASLEVETGNITTYTLPDGDSITDADIQEMARKYGITPEQVKKDHGIQ